LLHYITLKTIYSGQSKKKLQGPLYKLTRDCNCTNTGLRMPQYLQAVVKVHF